MILLLTMMNRTLLFHRHIAPGRWYCLLASGALSLILLVYKKCISLGRQPCCVAYSMMGVWAHLEASLTCSSGQIKRCTDTHTVLQEHTSMQVVCAQGPRDRCGKQRSCTVLRLKHARSHMPSVHNRHSYIYIYNTCYIKPPQTSSDFSLTHLLTKRSRNSWSP